MRDLAERFLSDHVPRKAEFTQREYRRQIEVDILPEIGDLKVNAVAFADIDALRRTISKRAPTHANRIIALASKMFTLAKKWDMRGGDNPRKGVERNDENKRKVYATPEELTRIAKALDGSTPQLSISLCGHNVEVRPLDARMARKRRCAIAFQRDGNGICSKTLTVPAPRPDRKLTSPSRICVGTGAPLRDFLADSAVRASARGG